MISQTPASAGHARNVPLFIAFRVLFNARWYYPVLSIIFLDLGLTLEQYALLNVAWAISIVCLEVPSGALADQIGRKRMLVVAAAVMVAELAILAFTPSQSAWLFPLCLLNRILSGAAEASASGADEALAYDSLPPDGRDTAWPAVLLRLMRWQSAGFFIAMLVGAAVYDPSFVQRAADFFGFDVTVSRESTMRFPIYLTLMNAILALGVTLRFVEPGTTGDRPKASVGATLHGIKAAGGWIVRTPMVLVILLGGLCLDSFIRLFLTVGSNFYRLVGLPEASFGLVGSGFAIIGFFIPRLAQALVARQSLFSNFFLTAALGFTGLVGIAQAWPGWGILCVIPVGVAMSLLGFFVSHYLNTQVTDSSRRATVLSFKGLCFNLGYGAAGLGFAAASRALEKGDPNQTFAAVLGWMPGAFAAGVVIVSIASARLLRGST